MINDKEILEAQIADIENVCSKNGNVEPVAHLYLGFCKMFYELKREVDIRVDQFYAGFNVFRLETLKNMPYKEYLKTPEWQIRRRRALESAGHQCEKCGASGELHVHHLTYERRGEELPEDLIVLCKDCHAKVHGLAEEAGSL